MQNLKQQTCKNNYIKHTAKERSKNRRNSESPIKSSGSGSLSYVSICYIVWLSPSSSFADIAMRFENNG